MLRRILPSLTVRTMLVRFTLVPVALGVWIVGPRTMRLTFEQGRTIAHDTGQGRGDDASPMGRRFFKVVTRSDPEEGYSEAELRGEGYCTRPGAGEASR